MLNGAEQVKRTAQLGMLAVEPENFLEMKCAFWEGRALSHVICLSLFLSPRHADHVTAYCIVSTRAEPMRQLEYHITVFHSTMDEL